MQDWRLIDRFVADNSQAAFANLIRKYADLVYCTCLRELGEPSLAEDATQAVFLVLAQKARSFRRGTTLSSWLFQTALLTSKNVRRQELRRQERERRAAMLMEPMTNYGPQGWEEVEPLLNAALQSLPEASRGLILERFLEDRPLAEIGTTRGISEDAARMRLNRALERLRRFFAARNVALSIAALAALLPLAVRPAPAHCAEALLRLALPSAVLSASDASPQLLAQGAIHMMNLNRLRLQFGAATLVAALSLGTAGAVRVTTQVKARTVAAEKQQDQARALAVLDRMYATYAAMHSFKCEVTSREDELGTAQDATYEIQRPNKIRFHRITLLGADMSGQALAVSDGSNLYVTCTENKGLENCYCKQLLQTSLGQPADFRYWFADFGGIPGWGTESDAGMPDAALGIRLHDTPHSQFLAPEYSLRQPVVLDLSGQPGPMPFDVVIARIPWRPGTPGRDWKGAMEVVTYYIGQHDHLLYKLTAADMLSPTRWDTRTETYNSIEVNPKLPTSDFVFTPPPGSHKVRSTSDLFPGHKM